MWGVRYFLVRIVKFSPVFDDFHGGAFSTAGAMDLHDFTKTPRLCTKFIFTAPVHKNERPIFKNGSETRVLRRRSAFSPHLCSETECETIRGNPQDGKTPPPGRQTWCVWWRGGNLLEGGNMNSEPVKQEQ